MTEPLDPLRLPLWGSRLIEASAGTGKTWTIAALYLRMVLGHDGEDAGFGRPLSPSQILVMTFTVAATRELSDRIRSRLVEAAACFRGQATTDPLLLALIDEHPAGPSRELAAWRLAMAAEAMDDASVHTIDAWCQRMLREHAFDSGSLFDEELQADETQMLAEAARDYWRQHVYPLRGEALEAALGVWSDVDALTTDARDLIAFAEPAGVEPEALGDLACRADADCAQRLQELKAEWAVRVPRMRAWVDERAATGTHGKLKIAYAQGWLEALASWARTESQRAPALTETAWTRLTPADLRKTARIAETVPIPEDFHEFARLQQAIDALPRSEHAMRLHAAGCVAQRLLHLKQEAGTYGFADMLERLDAALAGPNGARLRARITLQYPVALIDEFQDTSPLQYRLFDRLYVTAFNARDTALFLIGDPKQSIYGFRGADIRSYLRARSATAGRHYALDTNFRSTDDLVDGVNQMFEQAEQRPGPGAFRFRQSPAGRDDDSLPFAPVRANGRGERLVDASGPVPAITLSVDARLSSGRDAQKRFASHCAERIVALLNDARAGFTTTEGFERLRPADIAVLVRTGTEAEAVRRALRQRGVASVYLSDKDSVFASPEAADLLLWLRAVAAPLDSRQARVAFATGTIGLPLAELARLSTDDLAFEQRIEQLRQLNAIWLRQGVLAMLRQTLHRLGLPARWLAQDDGERRLTNVLHLAELLQATGGRLDGEQALIRWFAQQIEAGTASAEEHTVRLESDADLVQVVTVHKSKGLEYPLVFLPFVCSFRAARRNKRGFLSMPSAEGGREVVFDPDKARLAAADEERLQEDLRLLYVAVTRARHALWIGVSALKYGQSNTCLFSRSAFGCLMAGEQDNIAEGQIEGLLRAFAQQTRSTVVEAAPMHTPCTALSRMVASIPLHEALRYTGRFERNWVIGSFSALVRDLVSMPAGLGVVDVASQEELRTAPVETPVPEAVSATVPGNAPWHRFPRGPLPGNFLHDQLEWLAEQGFALTDPEVRDRLRRRCERQGWGHRADDVVTWLQAVTTTLLPPLGVALDGVDRAVSEMEFWFPADGLRAGHLDLLCRRDLLNGRERPALPERRLHGMLMGFADLMIEHHGRYWVLDYKSNALGMHDRDYHAQALEMAIAEHRYDVQATIYLLALHRLLKSRLGRDYEPSRHLGGAIYLFLRGIHGPQAGCHVMPAPLAMLQTLDAEMNDAQEAAR